MPLARVHSRPHPRSAQTPCACVQSSLPCVRRARRVGARTEFARPAQTRLIDAAPSPSPPSPSPTHIHTRAGRLFVVRTYILTLNTISIQKPNYLPGLREFGVLKLEALGTAREGQAIERIGMKRCEFIRDQFECTLAFVRGRRSDFDVCMSYLLVG
ncbi:hypothetical protein B0H16DRAFT_1594433 [Mycena metata]|uniref:Uncharacterized protein n=1 Tax=Mycena metata TaxID=1033252 RepID=A0AAD7MNS8_9AGAR|nr:hypothetical protein B0H16DRAFT_1594433 [Mycena metata]